MLNIQYKSLVFIGRKEYVCRTLENCRVGQKT